MIDVVVRLASKAEHSEVGTFYRAEGYPPAITVSDIVVVAELGAQTAGAFRVCYEESHLILRGMRVRSDLQRRGVGTRLLRAIEPVLDGRPCFCLPFAHLVEFYQTANFRPVSEDRIPEFLQTRAHRYRIKGERIAPMYRGED